MTNTNTNGISKTREVVNEQYYFESLLEKMDEIIRGQEDVREMLSTMSSKSSRKLDQIILRFSDGESEQDVPIYVKAKQESEVEPESEIEPESETKIETESPVSIENTVSPKSSEPFVYKPRRKHYGNTDDPEKFILNFLSQGERRICDINKAVKETTDISPTRYAEAKRKLLATNKIVKRMDEQHQVYARLAGTEPERPVISTDELLEYGGKDNYYNMFLTQVWKYADGIIAASNGKYKNKLSLYSEIFRTMNAQYGICWAQLAKDLKSQYNLNRAPSKLECCYLDEMAGSIFMAKLEDKYTNLLGPVKKETVINGHRYRDAAKTTVREITERYLKDHNQPLYTYSKFLPSIYARMDNVNWDLEQAKYDTAHNTHSYSMRKNRLIEDDDKLYNEFCSILDELDTQSATATAA